MTGSQPDAEDRLLSPDQIFRDYAPQIYHLARRMVGNDADAEDVTQDVLVQVVRKLNTFRGDAAISTWLHRVTVNAALSLRQKRATRQQREQQDPMDLFLEDGHHSRPVPRWEERPDASILHKEEQELIEEAIQRMPELYRDVYVLAEIESLPNAEIADLLGLSLPAVKTRLHRARLWMREALAPHFEEKMA